MLAQKLLAAMAGGSETLYVDDLFQAHTRTGTGASATVTTGINLSAKGGMIWSKGRSGATDHAIYDTSRGATFDLASNLTSAQTTQAQGLTAFGTTGHTWGTLAKVNTNAATYVDYVFAKAPKFFDVVTYTGDGVSGRAISHALGQVPGMVIVKKTNSADSWYVYHRSLGNGGVAYLEQTAAAGVGSSYWAYTDPTSFVFSVGGNTGVNGAGNTYVAYLFAHDTGTDGIVQCGSFTVTGGARQTITLGWEPQYLLMKSVTNAETWEVLDTSRVLTTDSTAAMLQPNSSAAESAAGTNMGARLTATGFTAQNINATYIYLAIRRPNKPPTVGTQVYNAIARTGTGAAATVTGVGFAPDLVMPFNRSGVAGAGHPVYDRLRGALKSLRANLTNGENSDTASLTAFGMDGMTLGADGAEFINSSRESSIINHFFKRAPGVFDVVCYVGQSSVQTVTHGLAATPELIFVKNKTSAQSWAVYSASIPVTKLLRLDTTNAAITDSKWNDVAPTSTVFYLTNVADVNSITNNYVAYLFATKAGISKVGSYTGNGGTAGSAGTSQTINCGFTTGSRFVMLKCTSHTSDWVVVDTVRGLVAGSDPALSLNTTAAEVTTTDLLDADTSGFIVNQLATGTTSADFNVTGRTYIFLSFA